MKKTFFKIVSLFFVIFMSYGISNAQEISSSIELKEGLNFFAFVGETSLSKLTGCNISKIQKGKYYGKKFIYGIKGRQIFINPNNAESKKFGSEYSIFLKVDSDCTLSYKYTTNSNSVNTGGGLPATRSTSSVLPGIGGSTGTGSTTLIVNCTYGETKIDGKCISNNICTDKYYGYGKGVIKLIDGYVCREGSNGEKAIMKGNKCVVLKTKDLKNGKKQFISIGNTVKIPYDTLKDMVYKCTSNGFKFIKYENKNSSTVNCTYGETKIDGKCISNNICTDKYYGYGKGVIKLIDGYVCREGSNGEKAIMKGNKCVVLKTKDLKNEKKQFISIGNTVKIPYNTLKDMVYKCTSNGFKFIKYENKNIENKFTLTSQTYNAKGNNNLNLNQICRNNGFKKAVDWKDLSSSSVSSLNQILKDHGSSALLYYNGKEIFNGGDGTRHYFIARHNGNKPSGWWAHKNISNYKYSLGSWPIKIKVLCIK